MKVDVGVALGLLAQLSVVIVAIAAGVVWLRKWLRKQVAEPVASIQSEVQPNQGRSLRDVIDRTETKVGQVDGKIEGLTTRYEDHLQAGHGGGPR
ncbi:MAG TPA: hypothetical protein VGQ92_22490 [Actinoplanes sp.]|jgi:hypothetical protein|nr:hypothetical protein [Actinoplanes sp.]